MRTAPLLACAALATAFAFPAAAQEAERYRLESTDDGYVRLDTTTGSMALCQERGDQLVCKLAADERTVYEDRLDAMQGRVEALEGRIAALEAAPAPGAGLPTEDEFEQTMGYMERFFRRFMGIVTDLERDFGGGRTEEPAPEADRT